MPSSGLSACAIMAEAFLHLEAGEQSQIYRALAPRLSRPPLVLEKDVWVCWVLQALFTMPGRLPMAFKGGTSLSKVFEAIRRFSEDVDVTLDYRGLDNSFDPFADDVSKNQLRKFSDSLKAFVRGHVLDVVAPYLEACLTHQFGSRHKIEVSDDGEQLRLFYATVLDAPGEYLGNSVLVEFGGRNITEPNEEHDVRPDIAEQVPELAFPIARGVQVLSPARTFWEKATLMHVECQRGEFRASAARLSRHWYDLAMLADLPIGTLALERRDLLVDVVKHKKVFYNAAYANYDACLTGDFCLIPAEAGLSALGHDFQQMCGAGMFIGDPPSFTGIVERLRVLEAVINEASD